MNNIDKTQMELPYKLAETKWAAFNDTKRAEYLGRFEKHLRRTIERIPVVVFSKIEERFPNYGNIEISNSPVIILNGHWAAACAVFGPDSSFLGIRVSLPLLFSVEDVVASVMAHECAHLYLRASGRVFDGKTVPESCIIRDEYEGNLPLLEEELEVDRLTLEWGFGDRNEYLFWETVVFQMKSIDCNKESLALKNHVLKSQLAKR